MMINYSKNLTFWSGTRMNSKHSCIRVLGQRSLPSTLAHRSSDDPPTSKKRSRISLSDFLSRKLNKTADPSKSVQGKERPFMSPGTGVGASQSAEGTNATTTSREMELNCVLDPVFEQFKHRKEHQDSICLNPGGEADNGHRHEENESNLIQDSRKGRNLFEGAQCKHPAPKGLVVLGGDPTPKRTKYHKSSTRKEKKFPIYNHYANGSVWCHSDLEGGDTEAVGSSEVWEGVGSTTLEGIDWH